MPLILGASLMLVTVTAKLAKATVSVWSVTLITIPLVVPTSSLLGVPVRLPVTVLKLAQLGVLVILKVRVSPSTSLAVGLN